MVSEGPGDEAGKPREPSIDWPTRLRLWAFLAGLTAVVALSANLFSAFAWSEHKLDLESQADNIGMPARGYLSSRVVHATPIGCVSANSAWPDACDYLWYSMLPYYVKPTPPSVEPALHYVIFLGDPRAAEKLESQASRVRNYQIEAPLTPEAVLLVRSNP
jgi:hypothetical protein